jgi:NADPH:quinone reductase-like Zn-dependent oxidoreductase
MTSYIKSVSVFENKANGMDVVVDLVDGETPSRSYAVAKKGGVLATTVQPIDESAAKRAGIRAIQVVMKMK